MITPPTENNVNGAYYLLEVGDTLTFRQLVFKVVRVTKTQAIVEHSKLGHLTYRLRRESGDPSHFHAYGATDSRVFAYVPEPQTITVIDEPGEVSAEAVQQVEELAGQPLDPRLIVMSTSMRDARDSAIHEEMIRRMQEVSAESMLAGDALGREVWVVDVTPAPNPSCWTIVEKEPHGWRVQRGTTFHSIRAEDEGTKWCFARNAEGRLNDEGLQQLRSSFPDAHGATAAEMFKVPVEEVTPEQRSIAKTFNLQTLYKADPCDIAKSLGLGTSTLEIGHLHAIPTPSKGFSKSGLSHEAALAAIRQSSNLPEVFEVWAVLPGHTTDGDLDMLPPAITKTLAKVERPVPGGLRDRLLWLHPGGNWLRTSQPIGHRGGHPEDGHTVELIGLCRSEQEANDMCTSYLRVAMEYHTQKAAHFTTLLAMVEGKEVEA